MLDVATAKISRVDTLSAVQAPSDTSVDAADKAAVLSQLQPRRVSLALDLPPLAVRLKAVGLDGLAARPSTRPVPVAVKQSVADAVPFVARSAVDAGHVLVEAARLTVGNTLVARLQTRPLVAAPNTATLSTDASCKDAAVPTVAAAVLATTFLLLPLTASPPGDTVTSAARPLRLADEGQAVA